MPDEQTSHSLPQICHKPKLFLPIDRDNITLANIVVCKVVGIGSIRIRTHDRVLCTLNDVRHVPQMKKNLISLSTFDSKGFSFKGEDGVMHIMKGSKVVLTALKRGTLYILKGSIVTGSADTASSEIPTESITKLWHMRLGHMGERGMQILSKRYFLFGHKVKNLDFCEHCVFWKLHRNNCEVCSVDKQVELQVTHNEKINTLLLKLLVLISIRRLVKEALLLTELGRQV
ncbi:hypothetical protein SASPL_114560 [Salvia splendens]|uniref:GAG-pre-integrase domain-containing protein n=1 Tax=Salvia splendens TaxID=180675 RepID=A0A8X8Y4Z2_SALSN|nr:hypothetical protein SASPL_114560 [Salvia splendens]